MVQCLALCRPQTALWNVCKPEEERAVQLMLEGRQESCCSLALEAQLKEWEQAGQETCVCRLIALFAHAVACLENHL